MKPYTPTERAAFYAEAFPQWPDSHPYVHDHWLAATWFIGNDYRNKTTYHGAYPARYLDRVQAMFPDAERILHLFSGSLPPGDYVRFDLREDIDADVRGDAQQLSTYFEPNQFDLILADPPYTDEDANKYGNPMVNRNKVVKEALSVLETGGHMVWLDMVLPMRRKDEWKFWGTASVIRSTNHRFRVATFYEKL